jgi:hypothetical protein
MAWIFELSAECGDEQEVADGFRAHFENFRCVLSDGSQSFCSTSAHQDSDNNWWACVVPSGLSRNGIRDELEARLMTEIGHLLCEHLRTAPPYRYALVGMESEDFRYFTEPDGDLAKLPFHGLVISHEIWEGLDQPAIFVPFEPSYVWRPYLGETFPGDTPRET